MSTERDSAVTSRIMSAVRNRDTHPELMLRRELHRRGRRYRLAYKLFGKPDIVFPSRRVAVFVDGDFWHGHGWRARGLESFDDQFSHRNGAWWKAKIQRNVARDQQVNRVLRREGWTVVRVLESEVRRDVGRAAAKIERALRSSEK